MMVNANELNKKTYTFCFNYKLFLIALLFSFLFIGKLWAQQPLPKPQTSDKAPKAAEIAGASQNITPDAGAFVTNNEDISRFCLNIDSQASEARFQLQSQQLQHLRNQIDERIKVLEEKRKDYEDWLNKRNDFLNKAQKSLVAIISKMRPDAAAAQLALVDDVTAASIILNLPTKISSTIMNELPAEKSANLTRLLVHMQNIPQDNQAANAKTDAGQ